MKKKRTVIMSAACVCAVTIDVATFYLGGYGHGAHAGFGFLLSIGGADIAVIALADVLTDSQKPN